MVRNALFAVAVQLLFLEGSFLGVVVAEVFAAVAFEPEVRSPFLADCYLGVAHWLALAVVFVAWKGGRCCPDLCHWTMGLGACSTILHQGWAMCGYGFPIVAQCVPTLRFCFDLYHYRMFFEHLLWCTPSSMRWRGVR